MEEDRVEERHVQDNPTGATIMSSSLSWLRRLPPGTSRFGDGDIAPLRHSNIPPQPDEYEIDAAADDPNELLSIEGASEEFLSHFMAFPLEEGDEPTVVWCSSDMVLVGGSVFLLGESDNVFHKLIPVCLIIAAMRGQDQDELVAAIRVYRRTGTPPQSLTKHVDTFLQLLTKHSLIQALCWESDGEMSLGKLVPTTFPASPTGIQAMLCGAASNLVVLHLNNCVLSKDQWSAMASHCPERMKLVLFDCLLDGFETTTQASGQPLVCSFERLCRLDLKITKSIPSSMTRWFASALEGTTSLRELGLTFSLDEMSRGTCDGTQFFHAIGRNHGLEQFTLDAGNMSYDNWILLWTVVGSHLTLQSCSYNRRLDAPPQRTAMDQDRKWGDAVLEAARSNTNLCELQFENVAPLSSSAQQQLESILNLNRFCRQVRTIQNEYDSITRDWTLANLLVSESVRDNLDKLYVLLRANPTWFNCGKG